LRDLGAVAVIAAVGLSAGCAASDSHHVNLHGSRVEVLGAWSGTEQVRFEAVLAGFRRATGAQVRYLSARGHVREVLDARLRAGAAPDVALLPQPGLIRAYVEAGRLVPLDTATRNVVEQHYAPVWQHLATVGGRLYGVWFKAADKSLMWYSVGDFERAGVVPPDNLDGLLHVASVLRARGIVPFSVGGADAWTLTDWFENLYLRLAGPTRYEQLTYHRLPWTDPSVARTLRVMRSLLRPRFVLGGTSGTLRTTFVSSVRQAFDSNTGGAAMLCEGDFVASAVTTGTHATIGSEVDAFAFPGDYRGLPEVVGGGDVAVQLHDTAAAAALMRYLASPGAAAVWAASGGFISPNRDLDLAVYPDALSRSFARSVIEAGDGFRFDMSDLQPGSFGSDVHTGIEDGLRRLLTGSDIRAVQRGLESDAKAAFGR
jgi:ABC-type glycerol-3-phosphate transport system substrate-binding protein